MGGRLTVTSKVHCGSTFTFILPYQVSPIEENSDDPDDLSDMADHDSVTDDVTAGFFQFQPRTLGSLFSSNGTSRSKKLLPNSIGFGSAHKVNGFSETSYSFPSNNRQKETAPLEDACSVAEVAETLSEPESSFSHSPEPENETEVSRGKQCHVETTSWFQNPATESTSHSEANGEMIETSKTNEPQKICEMQEKPDRISQSPSSSSAEVPETKPKPKPKILLVEDNKINVMVAKSMMKQLGHSIDVVNNGVEAVHAVQCQNYDLILMVISGMLGFSHS